jgi:hypothetical protein
MSPDRDWHGYNEALVRRGELELDSSVTEEWNLQGLLLTPYQNLSLLMFVA